MPRMRLQGLGTAGKKKLTKAAVKAAMVKPVKVAKAAADAPPRARKSRPGRAAARMVKHETAAFTKKGTKNIFAFAQFDRDVREAIRNAAKVYFENSLDASKLRVTTFAVHALRHAVEDRLMRILIVAKANNDRYKKTTLTGEDISFAACAELRAYENLSLRDTGKWRRWFTPEAVAERALPSS